jgi:ribose 5-phosphate isomerase A
MQTTDQIKRLVGEAAADRIKENMVVGIGSGSTVFHFIHALGNRVRNGLCCMAVPTSSQSRSLTSEQGITIAELNDVSGIDLTIDGADETDYQLQLIKGGGGFLLQEKLVASASSEMIVIADHTKLKKRLGAFPLPIEVIAYGWKQVQRKIREQFGKESTLRLKNSEPYLTDHGHYLLDCPFYEITDPAGLHIALHLIPGVVETGLFLGMATKALIGYPDGSIKEIIQTA